MRLWHLELRLDMVTPPPFSSALEQYELGYYSGNNGLYIKNKSNNVVQINDVNTSKGLEYINAKGNAYSLNTKAAVRITNVVPDSSGELMLAAVRSNDGYFGLRASNTGTFTLYFVQTKDLGQSTGEMKNIAQGYQNGLFEAVNDFKAGGDIYEQGQLLSSRYANLSFSNITSKWHARSGLNLRQYSKVITRNGTSVQDISTSTLTDGWLSESGPMDLIVACNGDGAYNIGCIIGITKINGSTWRFTFNNSTTAQYRITYMYMAY